MISNEELLKILNLPDIEIDRVVFDKQKTIKIYVKSTKEGTHCHCCGKPIEHFYGYSGEIELRHLPILGYKTYLVLRPKRYQCQFCEGRPTTSQSLEWYTPRASVTKAFEQDMLLALINSTLEDVSLKQDIGVDALQGILDRRIETKVDWTSIPSLEVVGIDEISLKKGHRDFVVIISAYVHNELRIIGLLADRTKAAVKEFFLSIPKRLRRTVKVVCSDLYQGFIGAAKAVFGKRIIVCADRFHVARLYRDGLESLRKKELKRLRKILSKEAYGALKNVRWILRKPRAALNADERRTLRRLFALSPALEEAYEACEALTAIYETRLSKGQGKRKLRGWMRRIANSNIHCFGRFLKTLETHFEEITNYFVDRQTSGFVEGLNNKLKVLKRRCYGITNLDHLYQRAYLDLNGYAQFISS